MERFQLACTAGCSGCQRRRVVEWCQFEWIWGQIGGVLFVGALGIVEELKSVGRAGQGFGDVPGAGEGVHELVDFATLGVRASSVSGKNNIAHGVNTRSKHVSWVIGR